MRRPVALALWLGLLLTFGGAVTALAHSGGTEAEIEVEPSTIAAGDTVVLAGSNLEPDSDRVLVLVGPDMTIEFGTVKTDADGMFSKELTIPGHVPSGSYELRAIGDETLTTPLAVTAASGAAGASGAPNAASESVVGRERGPAELGAILVFVLIAGALGAWLVWRAERFRGTRAA